VSPQVPRSEIAYLRGRCAFRGGDWSGAIAWYRKAISRTAPGERQADLEVHLGRSYELADELNEAVAAAQRAVRLKATDDRRLFLARLRLRRSEPELARAGLARLRSRSNQARGELMLGLYELRTGEEERGRHRLGLVSRDPWRGPAMVVAAQSALEARQPTSALELLVSAAPVLDPYWAGEARRIMGRLDPELVDRWRRLEAAALDDPAERVRRHALVRTLQLEPDPTRVAELRGRAAAAAGLEGEPEEPTFAPGLADRLWRIGLESSAVRWDPSGLPRGSARETWWTAGTELEHGRPWLAIGVADAARWQAASDLPVRGLPVSLRRALYPLPGDRIVRDAAARNGVPWSLLAGVAREESRWNPTVVSAVGARGLMQLMPATAAAIGTANGRPEVHPNDLFEPFINLDLGAAELSRLVTHFNGNRAAAVAAYNAGDAQAQLWLDQCGDGCSEARYLATVSFSVTRSYTEAVLASAAMYEELYGTPDRVVVTARSE
jgi:soluble lytic murein transglycosylase-like protein